jgi:hypothetical protein
MVRVLEDDNYTTRGGGNKSTIQMNLLYFVGGRLSNASVQKIFCLLLPICPRKGKKRCCPAGVSKFAAHTVCLACILFESVVIL